MTISVSTDYGLSRINPDNDKIESFFTNDGLLSTSFIGLPHIFQNRVNFFW